MFTVFKVFMRCLVLIRVDKNVKKMNRAETEVQVLKEYLLGGVSMRSLGAKYGYAASTVHKWVMKEKKESIKQDKLLASKLASRKKEDMPDDVKALQEELRITRIRLQLIEAIVDIADEQLGTQIRKKVGARQS
jgi:transposase-like protein